MLGDHWYNESIKTLRNWCDIALIISGHGRVDLLATITEQMFQEIQELVDRDCVDLPGM